MPQISGGGGQGRRPGLGIKGVHYFGETNPTGGPRVPDPSTREKISAREKIAHKRKISKARKTYLKLAAALRGGKSLGKAHPPLRAMKMIQELFETLCDERSTFPMRLKAASTLNHLYTTAQKFWSVSGSGTTAKSSSISGSAGTKFQSELPSTALLLPENTVGGVRQRLHRLLDLGPRRFGLSQSEVKTDLSTLPQKTGNNKGKLSTESEKLRIKYAPIFARMAIRKRPR